LKKGRGTTGAANDTKPVVPTDLNLFALARCLDAGRGTIGNVEPTARPHLVRCLSAGLLSPGAIKGTWVLSPAGTVALDAHRARTQLAMECPGSA
jgi:hypothetical protein